MALQYVFGQIVLPSASRGAGTFPSGPIINAGEADVAIMMVSATAIGGTPTLDAVLQTSPDGTTWTSLTPTAITQLSAAGQQMTFGIVTAFEFVQVLTTVAGTATPTVTHSVSVVLF
jgi:hypothetical protein